MLIRHICWSFSFDIGFRMYPNLILSGGKPDSKPVIPSTYQKLKRTKERRRENLFLNYFLSFIS